MYPNTKKFIFCILLVEPALFLYHITKDLLYRYFGMPEIVIYSFAIFIPAVPVVSFYLSFYLKRLFPIKTNLLSTALLGKIAFLFIPFVNNGYYFLLCSIICIICHHIYKPFLIELLKKHFDQHERSYWINISYIMQCIISLALLSIFSHILKYSATMVSIFIVTLTVISCFLLLPLTQITAPVIKTFTTTRSPWKHIFNIFYSDKRFFIFHSAVMLCGAGIHILSAVKVIYIKDILETSFTDFFIYYGCKMVGIIVCSPLIFRRINNNNLFNIASIACLLFAFHSIFLILAQYHKCYLYLSFLLYGCAIAGNHSVWYIAPLALANQKSHDYSIAGSAVVGIRNLLFVPCGILLRHLFGYTTLLVISFTLAMAGVAIFYRYSPLQKVDI